MIPLTLLRKDIIYMPNPFDNTLRDQEEAIFLQRSIHPGYIDLPFVTEEVLKDGRRDFGGATAIADLSVDDLCALDAQLDSYEAEAKREIGALRRQIDERAYALDCIGMLPLFGAAA